MGLIFEFVIDNVKLLQVVSDSVWGNMTNDFFSLVTLPSHPPFVIWLRRGLMSVRGEISLPGSETLPQHQEEWQCQSGPKVHLAHWCLWK